MLLSLGIGRKTKCLKQHIHEILIATVSPCDGAVGLGSSWCRTMPCLLWSESGYSAWMTKALMPLTGPHISLTLIRLSTYGMGLHDPGLGGDPQGHHPPYRSMPRSRWEYIQARLLLWVSCSACFGLKGGLAVFHEAKGIVLSHFYMFVLQLVSYFSVNYRFKSWKQWQKASICPFWLFEQFNHINNLTEWSQGISPCCLLSFPISNGL